jgi:hypothetical protein
MGYILKDIFVNGDSSRVNTLTDRRWADGQLDKDTCAATSTLFLSKMGSGGSIPGSLYFALPRELVCSDNVSRPYSIRFFTIFSIKLAESLALDPQTPREDFTGYLADIMSDAISKTLAFQASPDTAETTLVPQGDYYTLMRGDIVFSVKVSAGESQPDWTLMCPRVNRSHGLVDESLDGTEIRHMSGSIFPAPLLRAVEVSETV